jgi:PncC family amidohydrolase
MEKVKEIQELFKTKQLTLGSVESFTGGLFAKEITAVPGASSFYKGGFITYFTEEKHRLLNISNAVINQFGVVSKQVAEIMAKNGREILAVDCCVAFTGNAGPDTMENKPVGEVFIAISSKKQTKVLRYHLKGDRQNIQNQSIVLALEELTKLL